MQLGLLGPLEVRVGDREVPIAGARLRSLLCRLAVEPGRRVPSSALVDAVWPRDPPAEAPNALQSLVSRLRRALGEQTIITQELTGYRLALTSTDVDATVLAQRLADGRARRAAGDLDGADEELTGPPVLAVGSHDTASAVVGVPGDGERWAYLSSGTWSLIGLELPQPVLTDAAREADFTNEAGVDGTVRFLKNVMGLWVLSQSVAHWRADLADLLDQAARCAPLRTVVDIDDPRLLPPGDLPGRLARLAAEAGEPEPRTRAETVRCILDSLAVAYRRRLRQATELAGRSVEVLHVVGGGSRNTLLCQLTADACGVPVLAGPVEASVLGNALVQARALGVELPDLAAMRALVRRTHALQRFEPGPAYNWDEAERRVEGSRTCA